MMGNNNIKIVKAALNQLNFEKLKKIKEDEDVETYSFADYERNENMHPVVGFCISCEQKGIGCCSQKDISDSKWQVCNTCTKKNNFSLQNISHGSHTLDFLDASLQPIDTTGWHDEGVMFIMEGPSKDYGIYYNGVPKRPAKQW